MQLGSTAWLCWHRTALETSAQLRSPCPNLVCNDSKKHIPAVIPPPSSMGGGAPGEAEATRKGEGRPLSVRAGEVCGTAADMTQGVVRWQEGEADCCVADSAFCTACPANAGRASRLSWPCCNLAHTKFPKHVPCGHSNTRISLGEPKCAPGGEVPRAVMGEGGTT